MSKKDPRFNIEKRLCDIKKPDEYSGDFVNNKSNANNTKIKFANNNLSEDNRDLKVRFVSDIPLQRDVPVDLSSFSKKSTKSNINSLSIKKDNLYKDGVEFKWMLWVVFPVIIIFVAFVVLFLTKGISAKNEIIQKSSSAYENVVSAQAYLKDLDFKNAGFEFNEAYKKFSEAKKLSNNLGASVVDFFGFLPFLSKADSGVNLISVGENLSYAGSVLSELADPFLKISSESIFQERSDALAGKSFGEYLVSVSQRAVDAKMALNKAEDSLKDVNQYDFDGDIQKGIFDLKNKFPEVQSKVDDLVKYSEFLAWFLGTDNPKKFLIVSQNTSEARATGGFLGSYGLLSTEFGYVKGIFMDDIYNVDGQLFYKAIPPRPIQKISTAWSLHDSNWFLDFPTSAKKMAFFYEKAGGPTPDGVIAINEKVMERLLNIVGPISMPEYNVVLNSDNFVETIQYEVEEDYDKVLNRPKKILNDMIPLVFDKFSSLSIEDLGRVFSVFKESLNKKDILIWINYPKYQNFILENSWGGEIIEAKDSDYISVVVSNINGFKTDRVIDQSITKTTEIQEDGSIINTVTIKRLHNGGDSEYEWFNAVNSAYIRVYTPLGSELLYADGYTKEDYEAPIDYQKAGFNSDKDVRNSINSDSVKNFNGVDVFTESGKTVFGSWVYVSPQEEVVLEYKYKLPFSLNTQKKADDLDFVFQVQPGYESFLNFKTILPENWNFVYSLPELSFGEYNGKFDSDKFFTVGVGY